MKDLLVSIVIPCKSEKDNIDALLKDISSQKISFETEVIEIKNISPVARARNMGAKKAKGEILVFIDCDMRLGNELVLANLVKPLLEDKTIGTICPSIRIPPNASRFQKRYAKDVLHCELPIAERLIDIGLATSQCWAIFKNVFFETRGFNENMIRGEDSELSVRLKKAGYRIVMAPHTWCYHPVPDNIGQLIKINFRNGAGVSFADIFCPAMNIDIHPEGIIYFSERKNIFERIIRFCVSTFKAVIEMKGLLIFSKAFYAVGYFYGVFKYKILKLRY